MKKPKVYIVKIATASKFAAEWTEAVTLEDYKKCHDRLSALKTEIELLYRRIRFLDAEITQLKIKESQK